MPRTCLCGDSRTRHLLQDWLASWGKTLNTSNNFEAVSAREVSFALTLYFALAVGRLSNTEAIHGTGRRTDSLVQQLKGLRFPFSRRHQGCVLPL